MLKIGRVGKTSILSRYFNKRFDENQQSTVNPSYFEKKEMFQGKEVKLSFWDTAGQEMYNALNTIYYQGAVGGLIVYEVYDFSTFNKAKKWVQELQEVVGKDISLVIAGNKYDLIQSKDDLLKQKSVVDEYCQQEQVKHFYTSAKSGDGINEVFDSIIKDVLNKQKDALAKGGPTKGKLRIGGSAAGKDKKKGCC